MNLLISKSDHIQGNESAPITLLEYADYQCPYCGQAYYVVKKIQQELGENLRFVFRNFPIQQLHPFAVRAAIAVETAAAQGKFWEMHDIVFENQRELTDNDLIGYAKKLKLDMPRFEKDFSENRYFQKVEDDYESGLANHIEGTPAFFINGKEFAGNWMEPEFIDYLKSFIHTPKKTY